MAERYLVVLVTVAGAELGHTLAQRLVAEGLAACVQLLSGESIYRWQGRLEREEMIQLIIKTRAAAWPALQERIMQLHSDEVPEVLALPVADGLPAYLRWIDEVVTEGRGNQDADC